MNYTFIFTLEQINEMVDCMKQGPYFKVNAIIQELNRQLQAQTPQVKTDAQAARGNGAENPLPHGEGVL